MALRRPAGLVPIVCLLLGLAGCVDATVEVGVDSETRASATVTQVVGPDIYAMIKTTAEQGSETDEKFCDGGTLTENKDGSARCVYQSAGNFDDLTFGDGTSNDTAVFSSPGPGLVRVAFPTEEMRGELGEDTEQLDEQTRQMMQAFFEGHAVTLKVTGNEIIESNMTIAADKHSAERAIPFLDLVNGTADLPDELFAVVRVK